MAIRFLYFDLGNVLLFFSHDRAARQMAEVVGCDPEFLYDVVFRGGLQDQYEAGQVTSDQFFEKICVATGKRPDKAALMAAAGAIFEVNPAVKALVAAVMAAGYRTGVLSNTCEAHWRYCTDGRYSQLSGAFDEYVLSYEVGAMKPDQRIYDAAIEQAKVPASEIFFVDDREDNVAGAAAAGMRAVQYTSTAELAAELRRLGVSLNY